MKKLPKKDKALGIYKKMYLIRKYEEMLYFLFLEGIMPGSIHQCHGQEACAVGVLYDLRQEDYMLSNHRPAGHDLAKGVPLKEMMSEMFGKSNGCCHGKGGAMHTGDIRVGAFPANAIVGGNIPIAVGLGLANKMRKADNVVVAFFGDGASNEGSFHEGLNGAAIWSLPVIFVCENNLYGASTPFSMTSKIQNIAERASAYGMPGEIVDGNDVLAVNEAANRAIERARRGEGPTLLELKTYRIGGHSRADGCKYRSKEEESSWFSHDPILQYRKILIEKKAVKESELNHIDSEINGQIEEAIQHAKTSPDPIPEDALKDVFWEGGI